MSKQQRGSKSRYVKGTLEVQIESLQSAFSEREKPTVLIHSTELTDDETAGIVEIGRLDWQEVTLDVWERNYDAINLMSPSAFAYYLPSVIRVTILEDTRNVVSAIAIVSMLDRTPDVNLWDSHFVARWPLLKSMELRVVADWIAWLHTSGDFALDEISLIRALENLDLLKANLQPAGAFG